MEKENVFYVFLRYLKEKLKFVIMEILFFIVFVFIFSLYNILVEPVVYATLLCVVLALLFFMVDFINYYKRHKALVNMKKKIDLSIEEMPKPNTILSKDYNNLIEILNDKRIEIESGGDRVKRDLYEYCTLWAHQIKTPIAAMRLFLQCNESDENKELSMEVFKIEQYVEMILQYIRMGNMGNDLILKQYDLDTIIKEAIHKYAKVFIRKKISLSYNAVNQSILTDEKWLTFVIEQIISNSLKYTKEGTISIYMEEGKDKVLVIEDTGIGIEEEDLPRICEKGFTGYNGRADKKSTGIGLYLCREILKKLSHEIHVESKVGQGTKVYIDLSSMDLEVE